MEHTLGENKRHGNDTSYEANVAADAELGQQLDRIFTEGAKGDATEDVSEDGDGKNKLQNDLVYPPNYMPMEFGAEGSRDNSAAGESWAAEDHGAGTPPRLDALCNPYVPRSPTCTTNFEECPAYGVG